MGPERLPKDLFCGQLAQDKRSTGRLLLRYKDVCKRHMKTAKISVGSGESLADDRVKWRVAVKMGCMKTGGAREDEDLGGEETKEEGFYEQPVERDNLRLLTLPHELQLRNRSTQSLAKVPTPMIHFLQGRRRPYM